MNLTSTERKQNIYKLPLSGAKYVLLKIKISKHV